MSEFEIIREIVSTAGGGVGLIALIVLWRLGFFNGKNGDSSVKGIHEEIRGLKQYFNHDTTNYHERTHEKLDKIADSLANVSYTMRDLKENGVNCRDKKV